MGIGFLVMVLCNWLVLEGWELLPVEMHIAVCGCLSVSYFVLLQTLPFAIRLNELSEGLIKIWNKQVVTITPSRMKVYWNKFVRSKLPEAVYYAMTKFERDTMINYFSSIIDYTINLLLI